MAPVMTQLMPCLNQLQQGVHDYLIRGNVLKKLKLGHAHNYNYQDANFAQLAPHISLLPIPATMNATKLVSDAKKCLKKYRGKKPTAFTLNEIKAFLPAPGSQKMFIVARASSNVSFGLRNLSQHFEHCLHIKNTQPWFLGHITLGVLKAPAGKGFTQAQADSLNRELQKFKNTPKKSFPIKNVIFSEYKGKQHIL